MTQESTSSKGKTIRASDLLYLCFIEENITSHTARSRPLSPCLGYRLNKCGLSSYVQKDREDITL